MRTEKWTTPVALIALAVVFSAFPASAQQVKKANQKQVEPKAQQKAAPGEVAPDPAAVAGGAIAATPPPQEDARRTSLVSRVLLKVVNPDDARAVLEKKAAELGGFPILVTDASLVLKIPPEKLSEAIAIVSEQGLVIEKSLERKDLTQEIARLEGQLDSKRETLSRLRGFFDDSNAEATLRIEQTMTDIVSEIEQVKGQLRVAEERSKWAVVEISFEFRERDRIVYVSSPFEWLNTVGLSRFIEEF